MPTVLKPVYGTDAVLPTLTALQSLATSSTRVAGWTSGAFDNAADLLIDRLISAQFTVASTAPTVNTTISVYAYAAHLAAGTWPDLFSSGTEGTVGAATVHDEEQRDCGMRLLWVGTVDVGTSEVYVMPPTSLAAAFGGLLPALTALWVVQNTGQALAASGNAVYQAPLQLQSV
jgi:hypothetical protein